jgi:hypothetical protein
MKIHHKAHPVAAAALVTACLVLLIARLFPQIPVDLSPAWRPLKAVPLQAGPLARPSARGSREDFLACRYVLDELVVRAQLLDEEAVYFQSDAETLWNAWKNNLGVRGGWWDWGSTVVRSSAPAEGFTAERLQSELFSLVGRGRRLTEDAEALAAQVKGADAAWWRVRELILADQLRGGAEESRYGAALLELRAKLASGSDRLKALDKELRDREEDMDDVYPRFKTYAQRQLSAPPTWSLPRHWNYVLSGEPRPSARYDFETRYAEALERARARLGRGRAP